MRGRVATRAFDAEKATRYLYYWLLVALFFEYARPASYVPFLRIPFLYSAIPLLLLTVSCFAKGLRPLREIFADPTSKWIVILIGLITFSAVHADVTLYVYNVFKTVLGYVFLFIVIARIVTTEERVRGVIATLLVAHLFLLAMNPIVVLDPTERHYIVGASFLGDGNDFALSLCLLIPCVVELAYSARSRWFRIFSWCGAGALLLAIVGTQSRGGTLGMAAVLIYLWWRSPRKVLGLFAVTVVAGIVMIYAPPTYFSRMESISSYQEDGSAQGRIEAWKASINMAVDHPLTGVGAGQFPTSFGTEYRTAGAENMPWLTAHSSYFLVLGELGFPGLLCLLMLVYGNVRRNERLRSEILARAGPAPDEASKSSARRLLMLAAATVGLAVAGAFLSAAYYPHFYVLTALLVSARCVAREQAGLTVPAGSHGGLRRSRLRRPPAQLGEAGR